ncbi:MAG: homogentisate phytyltransferase [Bacteroidia bacterium]
MLTTFRVLWKFCRPHTVIGTAISIITIFSIICTHNKIQHVPLLLMALGIGIASNVFIVGINQIADVNIDKINKPYLPIPAGELSMRKAKIIVIIALVTSFVLALKISLMLFFIILFSAFIGWAYSMPPVYLKRHHITAALAITSVRGFVINVGGFIVFNGLVNKSDEFPVNMMVLTVFILLFSVVIAWFKDLPDIDGDSQYDIKSLAIMYSPKTAFLWGNALIILAYLFTVFIKLKDFDSEIEPSFETKTLLSGHIFLLAIFILNIFFVNLSDKISVKKFYKRFWWFFFGEYLLYLFAYLG